MKARKSKILTCLLSGVVMLLTGHAGMAGRIYPNASFAWSENAGWITFFPTHNKVSLSQEGLSGYAWAENVGWIKLAADGTTYENTTQDNWGVKRVGRDLQGYAWSESAGWINFAPTHGGVTLLADALEGYAWGENIGWIHFGNDSPEYGVAFPPSGTVIAIR